MFQRYGIMCGSKVFEEDFQLDYQLTPQIFLFLEISPVIKLDVWFDLWQRLVENAYNQIRNFMKQKKSIYHAVIYEHFPIRLKTRCLLTKDFLFY